MDNDRATVRSSPLMEQISGEQFRFGLHQPQAIYGKWIPKCKTCLYVTDWCKQWELVRLDRNFASSSSKHYPKIV